MLCAQGSRNACSYLVLALVSLAGRQACLGASARGEACALRVSFDYLRVETGPGPAPTRDCLLRLASAVIRVGCRLCAMWVYVWIFPYYDWAGARHAQTRHDYETRDVPGILQ
jgi:hypothetical protein